MPTRGVARAMLSHPFRVRKSVLRCPRALPWAERSHPFGVKSKPVSSARRADSPQPGALPWVGGPSVDINMRHPTPARGSPRGRGALALAGLLLDRHEAAGQLVRGADEAAGDGA